MKGQTIVELLLVIGLSAIILPALLTGLVASRSGKAQQSQRLEAVAILKETEEAVRNVRENDWNTFAVNGTFHPAIAGSSWTLAAGAETINGFTRSVVISDVQRDASGVIVASGGTVDPSSKKLVITVSWGTPLSTSIQSTIYLMRLDNITYVETTEAQFNNGTKTGVAVTNTSGGEITLGGGGQGDWCQPATPSGSLVLDLPKNGVANALAAIEGSAFAGTGENSSGVSFAKVNISNTDPPVATLSNTFDGYKTNDVFGETNYAYLATDNNSKEIVIIDLNQVVGGKYVEVGYFNADGNTDANSVFVVGNVGYMSQGNKFRSFDLSSKNGSRPQLNEVTLVATGTSVYIVGNYAYVSIAGHARELEIIALSGPINLQKVGWADVNGQAARDVFVNSTGTRTYIVTDASPSLSEFFIIDTTDKTGARPSIGSYNAGDTVNLKGVEVVPGNRAIIIGAGGEEEYQVLDISNEGSPVRCGGMQINSGINDSASVIEADGDAYSYIVTGDANAEFKIIEGGPGGQYSSDGTFESQTIPIPMPVNNTSFNRFEVNVNRPSQTDIKFQVAVALAVGGSCSGVTFNFVGSDGTNSSFFTTSVTSGTQAFSYTVPPVINPGQCFRYKIFLSTTDSSQTPIFYDITVNYAP